MKTPYRMRLLRPVALLLLLTAVPALHAQNSNRNLLLNQKGANGSITSADLVTDASRYRNYVMAGTFIRPFTVELTTRISF